jgi:hypothetical protein
MLYKLSNLINIQIINIIISKINLIVNYIYNLENNYLPNIQLVSTNYSIPNIKNIIIFILINLIFLIIVIVYIIFIIKIKPFFNIKLIQIFIKQLVPKIFNSLHNIFIFNFLNLYFSDYYFSFNFLNFIIFIFNNNFSLPIMDLSVIKIIVKSLTNKEYLFSSFSIFPKLFNSDLVISLEDCSAGVVDSEKEIESQRSNSPTASENLLFSTEVASLNFNNFTDLNNEDKRSYLINKYENKGMTPTFYTISWLSDKIHLNTDGNKQNVDIFIENYLNEILNLERDTQLKSKAFHRDKPFLRHLIYKTPLEYPYVIPAKNDMSEFELSEMKDALIKEEEEIFIEN